LVVDDVPAKALLNKGHILATDVANHLATSTTFREAYVTVASAIRQADEKGLQIHEHYKNGQNFDFETSIEARSLSGGTSRKSALVAIEKLSTKQ
jgi:argininosuccinate lyase